MTVIGNINLFKLPKTVYLGRRKIYVSAILLIIPPFGSSVKRVPEQTADSIGLYKKYKIKRIFVV